MKLTDKRFWKFEAMMLLCGILLLCIFLFISACIVEDSEKGEVLFYGAIVISSSIPFLMLYFAICGIPTWLLYKGNSWLKLAGYLYLVLSLTVIIPLFIFMYDWNPVTANMRPLGISPDEGKYMTNNELTVIISIIWSISLILPVLITSYLTKRWIVTRVKAMAEEFSLESIGVNDFAYSKRKALKIAETYYNSNTPILGGDVYKMVNERIEFTSDSWYCDRNDNETPADYVIRSYKVTIDYLNQYPDNTEFLFSFVTNER
ncbi:Imm40 family immunity protein [Bacteroides finegoldii]|uniref:Imm40 family immunity protein n=1 Tax=Bacteroides finegoldii TaxID=338188 RepID=UPI0018A05BE8|nr:Imm40 family immunity protein [Bacteroides finegoldii]